MNFAARRVLAVSAEGSAGFEVDSSVKGLPMAAELAMLLVSENEH